MGRKVVVIPEDHLILIAMGVEKKRVLKVKQFQRLKEILRIEIKSNFQGLTAYTRDEQVGANFYIYEDEIRTSLEYGFQEMYNKYRDELCERIQEAFDVSNNFQAKEVLFHALQKWQRR